MKNILKSIIFVGFILLTSRSFSQTIFTSINTGTWSDKGAWDRNAIPTLNDYVVIAAGHTITVDVNNAKIQNLTVNSGGILNGGSKGLTINGNAVINGMYTGNVSKHLLLTGGAGVSISGIGVVKVDIDFNGDASILAGSNLAVIASGNIASGVTVINLGKISFDVNVVGTNNTSVWTNSTNSTLQLSNELLKTTGILNASATGNTVIYYSDVNDQGIKIPSSSNYYNIEFAGIKQKNLSAPINVLGNVTINSGEFVTNSNQVNVSGNWESFSLFNPGTGKVVFNSTTQNQTIARPTGETFYDLEINNTFGNVILTDNAYVTNQLTMTAGNIDTQTRKISIGTSTASKGSLVHTSGSVIGKLERWVSASATLVDFPVGTAVNTCWAEPTFSSLTSGGTVTFQFFPLNPTNSGLSLVDGAVTLYNTFVDGYWECTTGNGFNLGANTYNLDLTGGGFTAFTIGTDTRILYRPDSGSGWSANGSAGVNAAPVVKRTGVNQIPAQFCFADKTNCTQPVTPAIVGNIDICSSTAGEIYSVTNSPGSTYTWTITGGTQTGGGTSNSITVSWDAVGMIGEVKVIQNNGCTNGEAKTLAVNVHAIPPSSISGKQNVPQMTNGEPYSVTALSGYTYTWSAVGGSIASGQGTSNITVNWSSANSNANVSVIAKKGACSDAASVSTPVNVYIVINSAKTGDYTDPSTWDCNCIPSSTDNIRILNPHTVTLKSNTTVNHVTVDAGGTLNQAAKTLTSTGDFTVDGLVTGTNSLSLEGTTSIDGTGTISSSVVNILGNKTILPTAVLTITNNIDMNNATAFMVINYGSVTASSDLVGKTTSEKYWTNKANSTLTIAGVLFANGEIIAEEAGNTVIYNGTTQTIKTPEPSTGGYYNLTISGNGTKSPTADLNVMGNLTINSTGQLDPSTGGFDVYLGGNLTNTSVNADPFIQGSGARTVFFNGTGDQTITNASVETFNNIEVKLGSNTIIPAGGAVTAAGTTNVKGTMTIAASSTRSGSFIDNGTITTTGKFVVQTYLTGNVYHYVSSPIKCPGTDAGSNAKTSLFTASGCKPFNYYFYKYNEAKDLNNNPATGPSGAFWDENLKPGWYYAHSGVGSAVNLVETVGYAHFDFCDKLVQYQGKVNTGTYDVSGLTYTPNDQMVNPAENYYDGWNLVGNPYPSSIDWDLIDNNLTNIDNAIYVWDGNQYANYVAGVSSGAGTLNKNVPPGQAFYVHTFANNGGFLLNNTHRVHSTSEFLKKSAEELNNNLVKLSIKANNYTDYVAVRFMDDANKEYDGQYDAFRLFSTDVSVPHLYTLTSGGTKLSVNTLPTTDKTNFVTALCVNVGKKGTYTFEVNELNFKNQNVYLVDSLNNTVINLKTQSSYTFEYAGGKIENRFYLKIVQNHAPVVNTLISTMKVNEDELFEFSLPSDVFSDEDYSDKVTYNSKLSGSDILPDWLSFDNTTNKFTVSPKNENVGTFTVEITGTDLNNATAKTEFILEVINVNDAPVVENRIQDQEAVVGGNFYLIFPERAFVDIDTDDKLSYFFSVKSGGPVPDWLKFNEQRLVIYGVPESAIEYEFELKVKDSAGAESSQSFKLTVTESDVQKSQQNENTISDIKNEESIKFNIYPIPAKNYLNIEVPNNDDFSLTISDLSGKVLILKESSVNNESIDISELKNGFYILNISAGTSKYKKTFLKK